MTTVSQLTRAILGAAAIAAVSGVALAKDYTITVWSGGSGPNDNYRVDAIEIAADFLKRQAALSGETMNIKVEKKSYPQWDDFKQAITLSAQAGTAPNIVVSGHEDIAPWAQSGLIAPVEDYIDLDSWPLNAIYPNLMKMGRYGGKIYGIPQDAEARPFFFWKPHMLKIGYSEADIAALPKKVKDGTYTLKNVLEDAKKMQDAKLVEPGYGFYPRWGNGPDYWQFYTSFGGVMEENGKLVFDRAAMTRFYQFFVDAVAMGVTRKTHIGTSPDQWFNNVATGKAGIWDGGTWHYARYVNQEGLKDFHGTLAYTLTPAGEGGKANTLTHPLVYLVTAKQDKDTAKVAAQLVAIASEPRINAMHAIKSAHLGLSPQEATIDFYAADRWARAATDQLLPFGSAMPNNSNFGTYWNVMWKNLEAAWTGTKDVKTAVGDAEKELQSTLGAAIIIR